MLTYDIGDLLVCRSLFNHNLYVLIESIHIMRAFDDEVYWYKICWLHSGVYTEIDHNELAYTFHKIS